MCGELDLLVPPLGRYEDEFAFGIELILDGLERMASPTSRRVTKRASTGSSRRRAWDQYEDGRQPRERYRPRHDQPRPEARTVEDGDHDSGEDDQRGKLDCRDPDPRPVAPPAPSAESGCFAFRRVLVRSQFHVSPMARSSRK